MLRAREGPHRARDWPHLLLGDGPSYSMMRACAKEVCAGCGLLRTLGVGRSHDHVGRCNGRSLDQWSMKCHCRPLAAVPAVPGPVCRIRAGGSDTRPTAGTNVGNPTARKVPRGRKPVGQRTLVVAGREDCRAPPCESMDTSLSH